MDLIGEIQSRIRQIIHEGVTFESEKSFQDHYIRKTSSVKKEKQDLK